MNKLTEKLLSYFGTDGLLYIVCISAIVAVCGIILSTFMAIVIGVIVGAGKEFIYNKLLNKGTFDKKHLIAVIVGIIIGAL